MRLLLVGGTDSPHLARWMHQFEGTGWEISLFASYEATINDAIARTTVYSQLPASDACFAPQKPVSSLRVVSTSNYDWPLPKRPRDATRLIRRIRDPQPPHRKLADVIAEWRPHVIHSFETQHAGYLTLAARELTPGGFPPWIHSLWGSDIAWFGEQAAHEERIRKVMRAIDAVVADCERDMRLAREWGFAGARALVVPGPGGFELDHMRSLRTPGPPSARRTLAIKGYDDDRGRGVVAIAAVRRCASLLGDCRIVVYRASPASTLAATRLRAETGLDVSIMPLSPVEEVWRLMGRSRIAIGLSRADGTPNTMLEAMVMGAFPIQSATPGIGEWIADGANGSLVPPEDPEAVAAALRRTLTDDSLVDVADTANSTLADDRLAFEPVRRRVIELYEAVAVSG
jgi:glycosyltransferase involved in cell wall biosynthesis